MIAAEATEGIDVNVTGLVVAVVLLALNGFFVAAEFALLAARRSRIEQLEAEGDRRARHALAGIRELTLMLAGAQLGITMCSLGLGAVAEPSVAKIIEGVLGETFSVSSTVSHIIAFAIALSLVVFLHMVVGEMAPKSWAIAEPERSALRLARPFRLFVLVFRPLIQFLNWLANLVIRAFGVEPQDERAQAHSAQDLVLLVKESAAHGSLDEADRTLLTRSLEMSGLTAADAMTPRRDIVALPADATAAEAAALAHRTGRTRIIVHDGSLDRPAGFVHVKDLLRLPAGTWPTTRVRSRLRKLAVTPEHHRLEDLLLEMRTDRFHIALVADEHGTVVGLVTLEDVIEELIGDFDDESDERAACLSLDDGGYRVEGTLRPDVFAQLTGVEVPPGDWHTIAGYAVAAFDDIPAMGDRVMTPIGEFEVVAMDGYAIDSLIFRPSADLVSEGADHADDDVLAGSDDRTRSTD